MKAQTKVLAALTLAFAVAVAGCGSSTPIAIALSLTGTQNLIATKSLTVSATVMHDSKNAGVTWALSPSSGAGTLSAQTTTSVTYTAPSSIPSNATATITATSVSNTMKTATLTINLQAVTLALTPSAAQTLEQTQTVSVTATISNDPSTTPSVTWSINTGAKGTLSGQTATGVTYHAPASVTAAATDTITATSAFDNTKTQTLTINLVPPPSVTTTSLPAGTVGAAYPGATLAATSGVSPYTWSWTAQAGSSLPPGLNISAAGAISGTPSAYGTFNVTVQVKDANNFTATANLSITIHPAPVVITTASLPNGVVTTAYGPVTFSATGGATPITWSWVAQSGSSVPPGLVLAPTGTISGTPTTTGVFNVTVTATDSSTPPLTASKNFSITIGQAPAFTSGNSTTFTVGTNGTFPVTTSGFPTPALTEAGPLPSGVTFHDNGNGTGTLSGTPAVGTGKTYAITFTATNGVGSNATQNFTLTVNEAPSITSANSTTFTLNANGTFNVTTSGFPTPTITESGTLPNGVTFTNNGNGTGTLAGTPTQSGPFPITFTATNSVGSSPTQNFTLTVNTAPVITSANSTTFTVGTNGSFTITATGTPTPSITESGTLPSGVTFTGGTGTATLSGTPAAGTGGTYTITFTAHNGAGTDAMQTFTLTVDQAPAITSPNSTTFTEGVLSSFTVMTTGFPKPAITEVGALPGGVIFVDNHDGTGTLSGTPASGSSTASPYSITFTANNTVGTPFVQTFTLTVNTAPVITSASMTTFTAGTPGTFTVMATGTPTPTITESGTLPSGVTFAGGTGTATLSGTPATGTGGTYSITFTATSSSGTIPQTFTLTVNEAPTITSASSATFTVGTMGTFTVTTTGFPKDPITETGALPSGVTLHDNGDNTATLSGTPAAGSATSYPIVITASNGVGTPATQNFTLTVNPMSGVQCPSGTESVLKGQYAFLFQGFDGSGPVAIAGLFSADGTGKVALLVGVLDINRTAGPQTNVPIISANSSYQVGLSNSGYRGCLTIATSSVTYKFALSLGSLNASTIATKGRMIETDSTGILGSGELRLQDPAAFSTSAVSGTFAFGAASPITLSTGGANRFLVIGTLNLSNPSSVTGEEDFNLNGQVDGGITTGAAVPITAGTLSISSNGRGMLTLTVAAAGAFPGGTFTESVYVVSASEVLFVNIGAQSGTNPMFGGSAKKQSGPFSTSSLSGSLVLYAAGVCSTCGSAGGPGPQITVGVVTVSSPGTFSLTADQVSGAVAAPFSFVGTYTVDSAGRVLITQTGHGKPGLAMYLVTTSQAYFGATGTDAALGFAEAQTGGPFNTASLSGPFSFGTTQNVTENVSDNSGIANFDGVGTVNGTSDQASLGSTPNTNTFSQPYSVTNGTGTPGRGTITNSGTTNLIFYIISPTKIVLINVSNGGSANANPPLILGNK